MTEFAIQARQDKRDAAARAGIDEALIDALVERFYQRVRAHPTLGPIFDAHVEDWPTHLTRMKAFWEAIAIESGRYHGNPMLKHAALPEARREHFAEWLGLWRETLAEVAPSEAAATLFASRADRIAESLQLGIAIHRDGATPGAALHG